MTDKQLTEVSDLLKPRFKVIAAYPNSPFNEEQIIEFTHLRHHFLEIDEDAAKIWATDFIEKEDGSSVMYYITMFEPYRHLFKRLRWFENRELSSLPEYLKGMKSVKKAVQYEYHTEEYPSVLFENDKIWCPAWMYEPATKEEYESFINQNKQP